MECKLTTTLPYNLNFETDELDHPPSSWRLLTVYFRTPNIFIALWFGFDYGTNPPLGTLII
jgi:hypothetical protein